LGLSFLWWAFACAANPACAQQIGKFVPIPANSDADHALTEINATTDPAQKACADRQICRWRAGDMVIVADDQSTSYYTIAAKNYDKALEYGDKLFALDPDSFSNAVNMVRAAQGKGDVTGMFSYGEKTAQILQRYKEQAAPDGMKQETWDSQKAQTLQDVRETVPMCSNCSLRSLSHCRRAKRAALLVRFAQLFPDSPFANQAFGSRCSFLPADAEHREMLDVANGLLAKILTIWACCCCWRTITAKRRAARQSGIVRQEIRFASGDGQEAGRRYRRAVETAERFAEGLGLERLGPGEYPEERTMRRRWTI